jgi:hypothetical protein
MQHRCREATSQEKVAARALARQGQDTLRLTWGKLQEASALLEVLHMFPSSTVHEVGLCVLGSGGIPIGWNLDVANLPPIGSSPDGLIYHSPAPGTEFLQRGLRLKEYFFCICATLAWHAAR